MSSALNDKQRVAHHAATMVEQDMLVGLGTGSTANHFIDELANRQRQGLKIAVVSSSVVSAIRAKEAGLNIVAMENIGRLDLYVDGADEVSPSLALLKGRGFDLVREKLLAKASDRFVVLVDSSKLVDRIGQNYPIPVEVAPFSWQLVLQSLQQIGGKGVLRRDGDNLVMTSHGSLVLDMTFDATLDSEVLNAQLNAIPGVVEHGVFEQLASTVLVGQQGQVSTLLPK